MVTYTLQRSLSDCHLEVVGVVLEEEEITSDWEIGTSPCLMLVEFKRENKIKENPISAYLICLGGL